MPDHRTAEPPPATAASPGPGPVDRVLVIGRDERARLTRLRRRASAHPIDISALAATLAWPEGRARHLAAIAAQTVVVPNGYLVTLTIETGHTVGPCRHLAVGIGAPDALPSPAAVWLIAEELGFQGGIGGCGVWIETKSPRGAVTNIVQPIRAGAPGVPPAGKPH
jgi:hypothetical protein